ncbi:hypothetical protein NHX12_013884 [Muraenolepis orangiensis]|uniref:Uncharacterized protein n=1 Tax=Muraenolepis orangiensis TaxID=630683 RepID=A0A9Q0I532_9TELE|nr:hypothetical protein NHX12_013884 [Muraenolepis orangiensis]
MKIVEDMRHQQLQHEAPTARNGDGDPASPEKRQAAEHKRAPAKTVKVSVLSDGSPKSVLKNTNRWCAHGVAPAGPDREIQTLVTDITEGQKEDGDVDVFLRETLPASSSSSSSSSPSPSPSPSSPLVEPAEEERVKPVDKGTSQPRPVTPATEPEPEDTGLTVTRYKVSRVHTPRDDNDDDDDDDEEDEDSLGLYEELVACVTDGESHYITTHEIQLTELSDEEEGRELGADLGEDTQLYSFVDYAPFVEAAVDGGGGSRARGRPVNHGTRPVERDPLSSDESLSKTPSCGAPGGGGPVHLSIKTTSRAINDLSSDSQEKQNKNHPPPHPHHHHPHHHQQHHQHHASARPGDTRGGRRYPPRGAGALRVGGAKCFIAAPGRFHFGRALKGREAAASSGGASSSALSELDDADKEVRHFTGRSFKSLAYPCLGALHLSSSSETSEGLQGANQQRSWSALVDLKCAKLGMDQLAARQNPTPVRSMDHKNNNTHTHTGGYKGIINNKTITLNNNNSSSSTTQQIELLQQGFGRAHGGVFTLTETVNFRCNVESSRMYGGGGGGVGEGWGERRANFAQKSRSSASGSRSSAADGVTDASLGRQGRGLGGGAASGRAAAGCTTAAMEDTHKKAIFASSLLKNVISKKMQFEEERKMERGEICEKEGSGRGRERPPPLQRQGSRFSEAGSEINPNIVCLDELGDMVDTSSCDTVSDCLRREKDAAAVTLTPAPETRVAADSTTVSDAGAGVEPARRPGAFEAATNSTLPRSQNSAFRSWRDGELQFQKERKSHKTLEETSLKLEELNERPEDAINAPRSDPGNDKLKKMSHLFVPTIQIMPDEGGEAETHLATVNYSMDGADSRRRITTSSHRRLRLT